MERRGRGQPYCLELLKIVIRIVGCGLDSIPGVCEYKYELQIRSDYVKCKSSNKQDFIECRSISSCHTRPSTQAFDHQIV
jgi:hypothetical protein